MTDARLDFQQATMAHVLSEFRYTCGDPECGKTFIWEKELPPGYAYFGSVPEPPVTS